MFKMRCLYTHHLVPQIYHLAPLFFMLYANSIQTTTNVLAFSFLETAEAQDACNSQEDGTE